MPSLVHVENVPRGANDASHFGLDSLEANVKQVWCWHELPLDRKMHLSNNLMTASKLGPDEQQFAQLLAASSGSRFLDGGEGSSSIRNVYGVIWWNLPQVCLTVTAFR